MLDPITEAGQLRCGTCGEAAYPSEASWLGDGCAPLLATYEPGCAHFAAKTLLLTERPTGPGPDSAWCNAVARSTGRLCRNRPQNGTGYCHIHQHQDAA